MNRRVGFTSFTLLLLAGCTADEADCAKLGDKFVELYRSGLDEDSRKLAPAVIDNAAEAGRAEVVEQCRRETYSKASVERCLEATTMDEFRKC
jgi:hypothetical protein